MLGPFAWIGRSWTQIAQERILELRHVGRPDNCPESSAFLVATTTRACLTKFTAPSCRSRSIFGAQSSGFYFKVIEIGPSWPSILGQTVRWLFRNPTTPLPKRGVVESRLAKGSPA